MYILQVYFERRWKYGVNRYPTAEVAYERVAALAKAGIKARVRPASELYS